MAIEPMKIMGQNQHLALQTLPAQCPVSMDIRKVAVGSVDNFLSVWRVAFRPEVLETLLIMCRESHPEPANLRLRGEKREWGILFTDVILAPDPTYRPDFSWLDLYTFGLPSIDLSIMGVARSHPSGESEPVPEDWDLLLGHVLVILTPPYEKSEDVHVYNSKGARIYLVVEEGS